jgi:oligopeptide transport system ATP-binding protein
MTDTPLLAVSGLVKKFGLVAAVRDVSFHLNQGETLALVGESGCGKTTLARATALLQKPTAGSVVFQGRELTGLSRRALKPFRRHIQLIFQDPYSSLNPRLTAGSIIGEPLAIHGVGNRREKVIGLAESVGLRGDDMGRYPHQFSGGQRQRIAIARALALEPQLIIADEPVSALDVSIQSQVLNLLTDLQEAHGLTFLFISHDLAVVRHFADRIAVMYLGAIVEEAPVDDLFADARHPYTRVLLAAAPVVGRGKRQPGRALAGDVPSLLDQPPGCPFHPRCPATQDICRVEAPKPKRLADAPHRFAACHFRDGGGP